MGNLARGVWDAIKGIFNNTVGAIVRFVVDGISGLVRSVGQFFGDMGRAAQGGIGSLIGFVASIPGRILSAIGNLGGLLFSAGADIVNGLIRGIGSVIGNIGKFLLNGVKNAVNSVLGFLGIKSPSRLFADIGRDMGRGMIVGLERISPAVDSAARAMAASATEEARLSPAAAARAFGSIPTGGGATAGTGQAGEVQVTLQQTNIMQPGTDVRQFASEVYRNGAYELAAASSLLGVSRGSPRIGVADILTGARGTM
jgi:phage-related protein